MTQINGEEPFLEMSSNHSSSTKPKAYVMTTATIELIQPTAIKRPRSDAPILQVTSEASLILLAGTTIITGDIVHTFADDHEIGLQNLAPGHDYAIGIDADSRIVVQTAARNPLNAKFFGGFHFAPGGNASERKGGDNVPAINPHSIWDFGFRPVNGVDDTDPRGMTRVELDNGKSFWIDIYLLGVNHEGRGTSLFGEKIADGRSLDRLNYADTVKILEPHGKRLPTYDEFRAAAYGVTERSSTDRHPQITGLDAARTSRFGMMQATGNLWVWGTDGDPQDPRPSIFGGSWLNGRNAGSRYASLGYWAGDSDESIGARGASDHLTLV
ncbi:hypothetical protein [Brucella anthropi]|uniref:hypothetical protein n=1 Tax=Brucella anthropi TaxID=529 RepID=UPI00124D9DC1|nr:hypothetical protein [Brucella anthropi]KAB2781242.1 hypothetical protein F9K99_08535 [Brucella anthropi]